MYQVVTNAVHRMLISWRLYMQSIKSEIWWVQSSQWHDEQKS